MKGNKDVIKTLNVLLADELTAIGQYMVHAEMCVNWGYGKLGAAIRKRAIEEMKHAEKLIERILFLEGLPDVTGMEKVTVGSDIEKQLRNDQGAEEKANKAYNKAIALSDEAEDNGTAELLRLILADEEIHLDWLETQLNLISQIGIKNYLIEQLN